MANLLESMLAGGKVKRQDDKHLDIVQRPPPVRPRQLFELLGALGRNATFPALLRAVELREGDPHNIAFVVLGRWLTPQEVAALPDPYRAGPHLTGLIRSMEFRAHLARRACESFPERKRLLFVRVPRSGGQSVLSMLDNRHPLLPLDLTAPSYNDPVTLMEALGRVFMRTATSNKLALTHTRMAPFLDTPGARPNVDDPFAWRMSLPPARVEDTLFAVLRDPQARALGQVNALLSAWQSGERDVPAKVATRVSGPIKRARAADWRRLGREILAETVLQNPICHALGDGTDEGARQACSRSPLQLVALEQLNTWSRTELENMASDPEPASEPILRRQDLGAAEVAALEAATREDQSYYDRFVKYIKSKQLPVVRARDIS